MRKPIDVDELKKVFRLRDGNLEKLKPNSKEKWVVVNSKSKNSLTYYTVGFNGRMVLYHVIVWVLSTGEDIPEGMRIKHINGNRTDNRIENLRLVTSGVNFQNLKDRRDGKLLGCSFYKRTGKYRADIRISGRSIYLGYYSTEQEALEVYKIACKHINDYTCNSSFRRMIKKEMNAKEESMKEVLV